MKAKLIKNIQGWAGDARVYQLTPEHEGYEYVVVSAVNAPFSGPETYIFPSNEIGEVSDWGELGGSQRRSISHEEILEGLGYLVS